MAFLDLDCAMAVPLTTSIAALSRKVQNECERKREAAQGRLSVGSSEVATGAFEVQTQRTLGAGAVLGWGWGAEGGCAVGGGEGQRRCR